LTDGSCSQVDRQSNDYDVCQLPEWRAKIRMGELKNNMRRD